MKLKKYMIGLAVVFIICVLLSGIFLLYNQRGKEYTQNDYTYSSDYYILIENGLYYIQDSVAQYYDYNSKRNIKLEENTGDSYYKGGLSGFFYDNKFYCVCYDSDGVRDGYAKVTLYSCDCDGSNKRKVYDFPAGGVNKLYVYQGKLYYVLYCPDKEKNKDEEGNLVEDLYHQYNNNALHEFNLKSKKDKILYELKAEDDKHGGYLDICETDDRSKIYMYYWYYNAPPTIEEMTADSVDISTYYMSEFLCYDMKDKKVKPCFTGVDKKHFFRDGIAVSQDKLYAIENDSATGEVALKAFAADGDREIILQGKMKEQWSILNGKLYLKSLEKPVLYDIWMGKCYQANRKLNYNIVAFSNTGEYIAMDIGDYSDLKEGDTYTKSRFEPDIIKKDDFLKDFHICNCSEVEGL